MLGFVSTSPVFWIILTSLLGFKIYLKLRTGMCKSTKRMDGKTVIVTGANTGIGKETARDLARRGAKVILACRNLKEANKARVDIVASTGNNMVEVRHLDLSSLGSVRRFANNIINTETRLDVLINNAGAAGFKNKMTADNLQLGMQVNHFGPFLLTCLLLGLLKKSAPSRIVMLSSWLHKTAKFDLYNLNFEKWFDTLQVYSCSKLANILTANELSRKLKGTGVTANSAHPGTVLTDVWRRVPKLLKILFFSIARFFFKNAVEGAQTSIYLAVSEEVTGVSGKYFENCKESKMSIEAMDEKLAEKLWEKSEVMVGLKTEDIHF
ncbi:Retinol dehydrogenase 14 [Cryptotermes secundus]|uniref:Retinol dehydrogenase 14 n=1 Tax=Cryptotermes secundus TaxID=105785 RepID=A0A2J7PGT0_9NEOP|nr:retinol dehydrogenase 14 [Cryptotermes secundus]PNF15543.1 Retinol dehydrogenase 14 [Cryptotermes secundus]